MSVTQPLIDHIPKNAPARVRDLTTGQLSTAAVLGWLLRDAHHADLTLADRIRRLVKEHVRHTPSAGPSQPVEQLDTATVLGTYGADGLRVTVGTIADAVVVRASGEVDLFTAPALAEALRAGCVAAQPSGPLVIDLTGIRFFAAAGLTVLVTTRMECGARQIALRLVADDRSVLLPLRITGVDARFDIVSTLAEATAMPFPVEPPRFFERAAETGTTAVHNGQHARPDVEPLPAVPVSAREQP